MFLKYKYIILRGRKYNSSDKREHGACIMQARWNINNYGRPPTSLPEDYRPESNVRPVKVHYYLKAYYSLDNQTTSSYFAYVSWLKPDPHRYLIGKPVELWCTNMYETFGIHSFVPIDKILHRCAYGTFTHHDDQRFLLIVPLVE